jgi:hypothetical protein
VLEVLVRNRVKVVVRNIVMLNIRRVKVRVRIRVRVCEVHSKE